MNNNIEYMLKRSALPDNVDYVTPDYMDEDILFISDVGHIPDAFSSKMYANVFCFCEKGRMELDMNGKRYAAEQGDTIVFPSGVTVSNTMVSTDFKFAILALTDRIMQELLNANMDIWTHAVYVQKEHIVHPTREDSRQDVAVTVWHFSELASFLLKNKEIPLRKEMLHCLLQIVLLGYCARRKATETQSKEDSAGVTMQSGIIFNRFLELLRRETRKHRPVYYYADKLCITPKHLTFVCHTVSGKTATSFIQSSVMEEVSHLLKNTTLSVKEIAKQMGFDNLSFFGKYVKAHLGVSPNEYRRQLMQSHG